jgi:hypothetical protein
MTLLIWLGIYAVGFVVLFVLGAMLIGYISENRTGAGYVLLGALLGAVIFGVMHGG